MKFCGFVVRPKVLPFPFNLIVLCCFYYSPGQRAAEKINFIEKLHGSADYVLSKCPNAGIFLLGDAIEIKLASTCNSFSLKQIVKVPTTKGNSTLDLICTNMSNFYRPVTILPPLGGSYHFSLLLSTLATVKHSFTITETVFRPLIDSGLYNFGSWITSENWSPVHQTNDVDFKALSLQRKLRKAASEYYNSKVKDLYSNKPKQWYRKIKEICGKNPIEVNFHLPEPP